MSDSGDSISFAKKYVEDLLSFFGLNTDVYASSEDGEVIEVNVPSTHMNGFLIGNQGDTMRSMQYLTSMALRSGGYELNRVNIDIADYKKQRAHRLEERALEWLEEVKSTGKERHLPTMNSADRRTIHKLASEHGLQTESEGEGRDRHIVLKAPEASSSEADTEKTADAVDEQVESTKDHK